MSKAKRLREQRRQAAPPPPVGKKASFERRWIYLGALVLVAAIAGIVIAVSRSGGSHSSRIVDQSAIPALQDGEAPWSSANADLSNRLQAIGLPELTSEGSALHTHSHIDIFLNGNRLDVPGEIGVGSSFIAPIHTHDASGVIHVESPAVTTYNLSEFFAVWGVRFSRERIGGYRASATRPIRFYRDGKLVASDPRAIQLNSHEEIAVTIGSPPKRIPLRYQFAAGE